MRDWLMITSSQLATDTDMKKNSPELPEEFPGTLALSHGNPLRIERGKR